MAELSKWKGGRMANPIYARLQATAQRLIANYGPGVTRRWGQAPGL